MIAYVSVRYEPEWAHWQVSIQTKVFYGESIGQHSRHDALMEACRDLARKQRAHRRYGDFPRHGARP
jgi:hypothetical protein